MKANVHPQYSEIQVTCSCGNTFATRSTVNKPLACRSLRGVPSVLHRQAEDRRHRRPRREIPPALRFQDRPGHSAFGHRAFGVTGGSLRRPKGSFGCLFHWLTTAIPMPIAETLADSGSSARLSPGGPTAHQAGGLVLLCVAWIALGLFGHDPWKPDDATTFGMTCEMLKHGDWVVPHLAGVALPDRAPLFYAAAAATAQAFGGVLPAARRRAHRDRRLPRADAVAAGAHRTRALRARLSLAAGADLHRMRRSLGPRPSALARHGRCCRRSRSPSTRWRSRPGAWSSAARCWASPLGLAFLFKGTSSAALIAVTAVLLAAMPPWRTPRYVATLAVALLVAAPMIAAWPLALYDRDPGLFAQWLEAQDLARFFGDDLGFAAAEPFYYLKNLPWFAWPALPLALWTLWVRARGFNGGLAGAGVAAAADHDDQSCCCGIFGCGGAARDTRAAAAPAAVASRRGRSRHAQARLFGRARLVRHPHLRSAWRPALGALARVARCTACPRRSRASFAIPSPVSPHSMAMRWPLSCRRF